MEKLSDSLPLKTYNKVDVLEGIIKAFQMLNPYLHSVATSVYPDSSSRIRDVYNDKNIPSLEKVLKRVKEKTQKHG